MSGVTHILSQIESGDPSAAEKLLPLVYVRSFAGLTMPQAAEVLGVSLATVENDWSYAKCWLRLQISDSESRLL